MKSRKIFYTVLLFALILLIWFANAKLFNKITKYDVKKESPPATQPPADPALSIDTFAFKPLKRDPFNAVIDTGPAEPVMPILMLNGVVIAKSGALALMALPDGKVYPMKKGETYLGVRIKDITPRQVAVDFRGKEFIFKVLQ